jgi:hypothetical protein
MDFHFEKGVEWRPRFQVKRLLGEVFVDDDAVLHLVVEGVSFLES